jgi:hypothetical protein
MHTLICEVCYVNARVLLVSKLFRKVLSVVHTKNFVRVEPVELARQERYFANAMFAIILSLLCSIRQGFRTRAAIQAEILALRHQLLVLHRSARTHKVRLTPSDRFLWVWLSRLWREWQSALLIVQPETVIAWQRREVEADRKDRTGPARVSDAGHGPVPYAL